MMDNSNDRLNIPEMPGMPKMIDNINLRVRDNPENTITKRIRLEMRSSRITSSGLHNRPKHSKSCLMSLIKLHKERMYSNG